MLPKQLTIYVLGFLLLGSAWSQTPYHQIIGGEVFSGIDIYGIAQDSRQVYWFTTNKGLYSFDGYEFRSYDHPDIKNDSFFNPTSDYQGNIYCNNLSGQIFKVSNGQMSLFHQVPDSLLSSYLTFDFLPDNSLVVSSKSCYGLIGEIIHPIIPEVESQLVSADLTRRNDGALVINAKENTLVTIEIDKVSEVEILASSNNFELFTYYDHQYGSLLSNKGLELYKVKDTLDQKIVLDQIFQSDEKISRIYLTEQSIWLASDRNGCRRYPLSLQPELISEQYLFEDYFISNVFEDHEGNILLGTFGNGCIVIPNSKTTNLTSLDHINASSICSNANGGILIGTTGGEVYEWSGSMLRKENDSGDKYVSVLEYLPEVDLVFADENAYRLNDNSQERVDKLSIGSIKDIIMLSEEVFAFGTNSSLSFVNWDGKKFNVRNFVNVGRTYAVEQVPGHSSLIVATSQGLKKVDEDAVEDLYYNGNPILVNDLERIHVNVLVATQKHGLLQLIGEELRPYAEVNSELLDQNVRQIEIKENYIFISTEGGFQLFNTETQDMFTVGGSDGLSIQKIQDFVVDDESIWFLHQKGIQKIKLDDLLNTDEFPSIKEVVARNAQDENITNENTFKYNENNLKFTIGAPSLKNRDDLSYSYYLDPLSTQWETNDYSDNEIEYQSLAPGHYIFQTRLNFKGQMVDQASYAFTIKAPFWQRWWFFVLNALTLVFLTYLFFRKRLLDQARRAEEINQLNESKLSALQSQMNPHFIFNALNSIQEYIILNERKLAGKYLGKFADLMRIYLNYSQEKFISLQQEIEALNLYLELEKLRFEELLTYEIQIDDRIEMNEKIPSLLIQPYVENALKHGLLHKREDRKLKVEMVKNSNESLVCTITDNGVGRKKSMEINQKRNPNHKSFATTATQNRLSLINYGLKKQIGVTTEDLYHSDGEAAGTKVELIIPLFDN